MDFLQPTEVERAVIGILASGQALGEASALAREDFTDKDCGRIFAAFREQGADSLSTLNEILTREFGAERADVLMEIAMSAMQEYRLQSWNLGQAVRLIRDAAGRRKLIRISEALNRGAQDAQRDLAELMDSARTALSQAVHGRGGWIQAADACMNAYEAAEHKEAPVPTGIRNLDAILCGGLHRGELTILGARPAVGKSAVLLQMAMDAARNGARVCFASLEMSAQQIGARILSAKSGVNAGILRSGQSLKDGDWDRLADGLALAGAELGDCFSLLVRGGLTIEELRAELHDKPCDLLFVDYLQLLKSRQKTTSDFERIGIVSRGLKAITLDLGIPVVAAAQVRRQNGVSRAPTLDELRGSGDIEQDADNVILLSRADDDGNGAVRLTFDVAKQRQGITASTQAFFYPSQMRFLSGVSA